MANIVYRQMPALRSCPNKSPSPGQKLGCKSLDAKFLVPIPEVRGGGGGEVVMDEIDTGITLLFKFGSTIRSFLDRHVFAVGPRVSFF